MVLSIGTEFIENEDENYDKQDCEMNAFQRLSQRIKKDCKVLPIFILGDSLYGVEPIFQLCEKNNWKYIFTLKQGRTKSKWEELRTLKTLGENNKY